jgi:signal peptidase I
MTTLGIAAALALIIMSAGLLLSRRRVMLVTVKGQSMAPAYRDGERLLVVRRSHYAAGDVVMFRTPGRHLADVEWMVKRAAAIGGDSVPDDLRAKVDVATVPAGSLLVRSDAVNGLDSRHFGLIDAGDVLGVVRSAGYRPYSAAKRRINS